MHKRPWFYLRTLTEPVKQRLRTWGLVILINLCALLFALFLATEWFIARKARTTLIYQPNPHYRQALYPNQTYQRDGFRYTIGPHSLRGEEPRMPKPKDTLRVFVLGGSSVFDFRVPVSWPEQLQLRLREHGLKSVEVFNGGIPGFSTREVLPFYEHRIKRWAPDVVLLYAGWNDVKYMKAFQHEVVLKPHPHREDPKVSKAYRFLLAPRPLRNWYALPMMLDKAQQRILQENTMQPPTKPAQEKTTTSTQTVDWANSAGMRYWRQNLQRFCTMVRDDGALPVFVAEATLTSTVTPQAARKLIAYRWVGFDHDTLLEINELMVASMRETNTLFIDPRAGINGRPEYFYDHVHLQPAGSAVLAGRLAEELMVILSSRAR